MTAPVTAEDLADFGLLLANGRASDAIAFATALLGRGIDPQDVLLDLIAPSQLVVGDRWARAQWSIAQEHAATHISEQVIDAVSGWAKANTIPHTHRGTAVVACVDGEWHALPARLFAEVIRLHGWDVHFLGASVPGPHLVSYLHEHGPDVLAVSCSMPTRLVAAHRIITAAQEAGVPVIAGGAGFGPDARWALRLGADRVAASAAGAVRELAHWPPPLTIPVGVHVTADFGNDDHVHVALRRDTLVTAGLHHLERTYAQVREYTQFQRETTRADLEHIIDFLASALFIDDAELFTGFIAWLDVVLSSRHAPLTTIDTILSSYITGLAGIPRAVALLHAARLRLHDSDTVPLLPEPGEAPAVSSAV